MNTDRNKSIEAAISNIQRQFGQGAIMRFTEDSVNRTVDVIPTGSLTLDIALGIGGIPRGRVGRQRRCKGGSLRWRPRRWL